MSIKNNKNLKKIIPLKERLDPGVVQRQASDPKTSAWVTASAGTGKTKVLIDRVLRLLLDGAKADQILCMTFTRAAASAMISRIREELSVWATCDDNELSDKLKALTGKKPEEAAVKKARQLFAEYLDAPQGLRIQTIHSFAQDILRRFPIESGIPPYFDVMDEQTAAEILRESQADIMRQVKKEQNTPLARAVKSVTPEMSEDDFAALIGELTYRRGQLLTLIDENGGLETTIGSVYKYLNAPQGIESNTLITEMHSDKGLNGYAPDLAGLKIAVDVLSNGTPTEKKKAMIIRSWIENPAARVAMQKEYLSVFLTKDGNMQSRLTTKKTASVEEIMQAEALRLIEGSDYITNTIVARKTDAILRLSDAILKKYAEKKRALNLLDYDDLVFQTHRMMAEKNATGWVLQKLPGDLKHILVDEAQDTNPDQWRLMSAIVEEFFKNPARKNAKDCTFFAVGDEKQSIFSFQQADPAEAFRRKKFFADLVTQAGSPWREIDMAIAFRSSPAVTQVVDAVFANPEANDGLFSKEDAGKTVRHTPFRQGQAGLVELHPVIKAQEYKKQKPWTLPTKMEETSDPAADLADQIADQIKGWMDSGEELAARKRKISPSDIMILVRRRNDFVEHMVRALKRRNIPVAGVDRLSLREQIVVMDLVAMGEALLFPKDDYKLACILKSPFIGMTDADLEKIAIGRAGALWEALAQKAEAQKTAPAADGKIYLDAFEYLSKLRDNLNIERPYEFYSSLLMNACPAHQKSGLYAIYSRLGFEVEDPLIEFMNAAERFERIHVPTLQGFLAWLDAGEAEVKREMSFDREAPRVHIMTVHSAKGLEAPIVILPDTTGIPSDNAKTRPKFLWPEGARKVPLWTPRADMESKAFARERAYAELERDREFRRLLYVAMTRAEDRLYVFGYEGTSERSDESWYDLIKAGLEKYLKPEDVKKIDVAGSEDKILKFEINQTARTKNDGVLPPEPAKAVGIPAWARNAPKEDLSQPHKFKPTSYNELSDDEVEKSPLENGEREMYNLRLGNIVHSLFEILPNLPKEDQTAAVQEYLSRPVWALSAYDQQETAKQVLSILNDPVFGSLFGSASKAEVSISGPIDNEGRTEVMSGRIDRLVVDEKTVTIVDFKNGRKIPANADTVPFEYIVQMAAYRLALQQIYPDREIKCALIYTRAAHLVPISGEKMDAALKMLDIKAVPGKKPPNRKIG